MANLIKGIDVSRWQGTDINWEKVKTNGYLYSFMKVTDGSAYSNKFIEMGKIQSNDAKKAGLKIGYYHFAHPSNFNGIEKDAKEEANYFLKILKTFPTPNFPLVLDLEDEKMTLTQDETEKWIIEFKRIITNAGFELIIYSYSDYLNRSLPKNHQLGQMPLWLASYPKVFDINVFPKNPTGWTSWIMWQYSDKGKPNGFTSTGSDLNLMTKDFFNKY
ncbi:glycoside hydrolase family 25 protein [Chryseobacterium schmidteae]|uniref:glycoside hydrolase family 25 protein n=1 Tax=Chryseobacterium schmidteae TaxID=2730404 RepID=UPI0015886F83|nr:glycoside hydrolase family 25 protein [Chryseobacterium schmidteae]